MAISVYYDQYDNYAGDELRRYFAQATGTSVPRSLTAADCDVVLTSQLGDTGACDFYEIQCRAGQWTIRGVNRRSALFGVYDFLERLLGIRFFTPEFTWIPLCHELPVPENYDHSARAGFALRQIRLELNLNPVMVDWAARQRFNSITANFWDWDKPEQAATLSAAAERGLRTDAGGHGMFYFLPAERYFSDHPEWFPEHSGSRQATRNTGDNFCYSNTQAREEFIRNVAAYAKRFPQMKRIDLWPGDGGMICQCLECRQKTFMELYTALIAQVRSALVNDGIEIGQLAYNFDARDKQCQVMQVPDRLPQTPTMYAFWGQDLSHPLKTHPEPGHQYVRGYINTFASQYPGQAAIFSYHGDTYSNSNLCPCFESALAEEMRYYHDLGIQTLCLLWVPWDDKAPELTQWIAAHNAAIWGRTAWDHHLDLKAYRHDYLAAISKELDQAGKFWYGLHEALSMLSPLIFPFAPPRLSDAWGCAFNRAVLAWDPSDNRSALENERQAAFVELENKLAALEQNSADLAASPHPEASRLLAYWRHCLRRARGLLCIFAAQRAIRQKCWPDAHALLCRALDTGMPEEQEQTRFWLCWVDTQEQRGITRQPDCEG